MRKKIFKWLLILFVVVFLFSSFTSSAANLADDYTYYEQYWECDGYLVPYTLVDRFLYYDKVGNAHAYYLDKPCYAFAYLTSTGSQMIYVCNKEPFSYTYKNISANTERTQSISISADRGFAYTTIGGTFTEVTLPYFSIANFTNFMTKWNTYFMSDSFIPITPMTSVDIGGEIIDSNFALVNPKASLSQDGVLFATWSLPLEIPAGVVDMPLLVDLVITDNDSGQRSFYSYPAKSSLPDANRLTFYDVHELELSFNIDRVDGLPTNYRLEFVNLTPYYTQSLLGSDGYTTHKGQVSMIRIGVDGTFGGGIQILPDAPLPDIEEPESPEWGIFGLLSNFFSGFFNNLGGMLKDLFIPTESQFSTLYSDSETYFRDKLGFLWYPFDLAINVVNVFTSGTADSTFTVPPIDINILGGVHLYDGGTFDIDELDVFTYVRFVTSIIICSAILRLAINKWSSIIGGAEN